MQTTTGKLKRFVASLFKTRRQLDVEAALERLRAFDSVPAPTGHKYLQTFAEQSK